ncbi:MAG: hypothetical protein O2819_01680 [Planctomycetota bacterium]|nr:hypothetical protein [Planctomycetota bacterium]
MALLSLAVVAATGCAKKGNTAGTNGSALDISSPPPAVAYEPPVADPVTVIGAWGTAG